MSTPLTTPLGIGRYGGRTGFAVRSPQAEAVDLCLFDRNGAEHRLPMRRIGDDWQIDLEDGSIAGRSYAYRAHGVWAPERGLWFDSAKLLVDPYAMELDRRFTQHPMLAAYGVDTAAIVPRAIVPAPERVPRSFLSPDHGVEALAPPCFTPGGLIYEINVKGFTQLHPDVPEHRRGTVAALAHPAIIAHLRRLHVGAVELMPLVAWLDERHLPPLGLANLWGYNPVAPMALDPGLCPGGIAELQATVAALHGAGIGVILDLVLNHTGESDSEGGVLCLRGLDDSAYARAPDGRLINDTGCGNMLDFSRPHVRELALATLRHFVRHAGVDGFRLDLAAVLGRGSAWGGGFDRAAPIFAEIAQDPWLADRIMIAEPWDIGPGGYRLGQFPPNWLEWNDRFRDDVRRFWRRGEGGTGLGLLATRLAGSADIFGEQACRSVNFLAAHDGFTLADCVSYTHRRNEANGENNRDGHTDNASWNCGEEGHSTNPAVLTARAADLRAMLATLFASAGTIMLTAGDEFGRSQQGNNNAYCQDNRLGWVDWTARDVALEDYVADLAAWRAGAGGFAQFPRAGDWLTLNGAPMAADDWENAATPGFRYRSTDRERAQNFTLERAARRVVLG